MTAVRSKKHHLLKLSFLVASLLTLLATDAAAQYSGWQHSGSMFILTTPEGADLPASAVERDFPLLVRLHKDFFDFSQARADGADVRFSTSAGEPLAHQIEKGDAARGTASIWVRMPIIQGNARQEIKLHWGKADATSVSAGERVARVCEWPAGWFEHEGRSPTGHQDSGAILDRRLPLHTRAMPEACISSGNGWRRIH